MKYKAVIFDLDGTLADTSEGIFAGIRLVQDKMQLMPLTLAQMRTHIGPSPKDSFSHNFNLTGERLDTALSLYKDYANSYAYQQAKLYDGIETLIKDISASGAQCAIATLKLEDVAVKMMKYFGIDERFAIIKGAQASVHLSKADLLKACLSELSLKESAAVLIGDSQYDAIGAEQAGVDFIGVTYGYGFTNADDVNAFANVGVAKTVAEINQFL